MHLLLESGLPGKAEGAKRAVYGAMRKGRLFIAHDRIAPAKGFRFNYAGVRGTRLGMGQEAVYEPGVFSIRLPRNGSVRLIRDGAVVRTWRERTVSFESPGPGVYRVEAFYRLPWFGWRPWIFSNPIYLR